VTPALSHDGELYALCDDETVRVGRTDTGGKLKGIREPGVTALAFAPDGRLATAEWKRRDVRLFDPRTGRCLARSRLPDLAAKLVFAPDGSGIAASNYGSRVVTLWQPPAASGMWTRDRPRRLKSTDLDGR
jgi:WD40 repeat protein